jgi:hypothetical protein
MPDPYWEKIGEEAKKVRDAKLATPLMLNMLKGPRKKKGRRKKKK